MQETLTLLGHRLTGEVIDIGAGTGQGAAYLDGNHTSYLPTDLPGGRDHTDARISRKGQAPVHHCSVYELPFETNRFGGGLMLMVLEHLEFPARGLQEVFRVLKPGSFFLVSVPFAFPMHGMPSDFRRWTTSGIKSELVAAGFAIEEIVPTGGVFGELALNLNLALRFQVMSAGPYLVQKLFAVALPLRLFCQAIVNSYSVILDKLDRSNLFPLAIVVLARKAQES